MHLLNSDTLVSNAKSTDNQIGTEIAKANYPRQLCFDFESDVELPLTKHIEGKVDQPERSDDELA